MLYFYLCLTKKGIFVKIIIFLSNPYNIINCNINLFTERRINMSINDNLESVRATLYSLLSSKQDKLLDNEILSVSMELDELINDFMRDKYKTLCSN